MGINLEKWMGKHFKLNPLQFGGTMIMLAKDMATQYNLIIIAAGVPVFSIPMDKDKAVLMEEEVWKEIEGGLDGKV